MAKVFRKESAEELYVQLSNGRMLTLEELVEDYERFLKEESSKKAIIIISETKDNKAITSELKVGEWFLIDREVIDKSKEKIRCKCYAAGTEGKKLWKRFEKSNKIADENPDQYPRLIETYIFKHNWDFKTEQEMRDMSEEIGEGMCDEIICDFELQMRICNGESVDDLLQKPDKLPRRRAIKFRNGRSGYFGGSADFNDNGSPADLFSRNFDPFEAHYEYVPYAFRRKIS